MTRPDDVPDEYDLRESLPSPETFVALRDAAGMTARSRDGVERGLPNSLFGVTVVHTPSGEPVGMGRGLGTAIMTALDDWIAETAPPNAYVNLFADVDGFYERFGFEETRPASTGMYRRTE